MKRSPLALLAGAAAILLLAGCSSTPADPAADAAEPGETQVLKVAATTTPMPDVVRAAAEAIEAPYEIELVEVADYVQPNTMLAAGELDANFVQHPPFMEDFNKGNNASLVAIEPVYLTVVGTYSSKHDSMAEIPEKGHIVVPQDLSNQSRALQMYAEA
ncbi:MAG: D-methionine-binding lipoprotein MetQ, partial [Leucobacter sp.]|nr:D-methionine-binding lipoprotein MetQ [Leucobacter sp.]